MKGISVFKTLSQEKAEAVSKALEKEFPVKSTVGFTHTSTDYEVYILENRSSYKKRDFSCWSSGFIYAKFGE
jgi:hypothetical protein